MTRGERNNLLNGLFFVVPWLIGLGVFITLPAMMSAYYSLSDFSVLTPPVFIGTRNYVELAYDEVFWIALYNTVWFALFSLPLGTILALCIALMLNTRIFARSVFRTIFFLPSLVPMVALAMLWQWIFNAQYGVINVVLSWFGVEGPNWLGDVHWSKPALVITGLWTVGNAVVIYLAGLQDIPVSLYESADIDGANIFHKIRHITLPMLSPVIYFNLMMGSIGILQEFVRPFVMFGEQGAPARSTLFYTMYLYTQAFRHLNMGYACAMGVILFALIALLTWTVHRLSHRHVHYGGM